MYKFAVAKAKGAYVYACMSYMYVIRANGIYIYTSQGNMKLFRAKMKVNTCNVCEIGLFTEEEDVEQIGVLAISCMSL